jgi:hypothetical protein
VSIFCCNMVASNLCEATSLMSLEDQKSPGTGMYPEIETGKRMTILRSGHIASTSCSWPRKERENWFLFLDVTSTRELIGPFNNIFSDSVREPLQRMILKPPGCAFSWPSAPVGERVKQIMGKCYDTPGVQKPPGRIAGAPAAPHQRLASLRVRQHCGDRSQDA